MQMDEDMRAMARGSYGYGCWKAPYWFVGPEQGMAAKVNDLNLRVQTWLALERRELNDCREFHHRISETQWHFKTPKVDLQMTWRPLLLLLMTFLDKPADNDSLRNYQRDRWGTLDGETCVIELSGLAAPNAKEAKDTSIFLPERIDCLCRRMLDHPPRLVVMYGREQKPSWTVIGKAFTGNEFPPDSAPGQLPKTNILTHDCTILVCTPHPSRPIWDGTKFVVNEYWKKLGKILRELVDPNCLQTDG